MNELKLVLLFFAASFMIACGSGDKSESNEETTVEPEVEEVSGSVSFGNIQDGDTLTSPFLMEMYVEGMTVEPKGEPREGYGHHHLLINDGFIDEGIVIIADSTHIHYGGGQTSDSVALAPGNYQLTLQFADGMHVSYGENWSASIDVVVE